jgi:nitrogen regulatory protein PII
MAEQAQLQLITAIIQHKDEKDVLEAVKKAGAPAVTYFYGRGTGIREKMGLLGVLIESEKVILMMSVPSDKTKPVIEAIKQAAHLDVAGRGYVFVQNVELAVGA